MIGDVLGKIAAAVGFASGDEDPFEIKPRPEEEVSRYAIVFNGTAGMKDMVADLELGLAKELVNTWLKNGYDKIFLLMDAKNPWAGDPRVVMMEPTEHNLRMATGALKAAGLDSNDNVEIMVMGHGGGDGEDHGMGTIMAADFVSAINMISANAQRIIRLSQCHSVSFLEFKAKGVRDDNDLLMGYAGAMEPKKEKGGKEDKKTELNWLDGRSLGVLDPPDVDGDGDIANWEMFWQGIKYSFKRDMPLTRGFIFDPGPKYIDYGFGETPLDKPFPAKAVIVNDFTKYVELAGKGYDRGITVVGIFTGSPEDDAAREKFREEAKRHGGWVQFLELSPELSRYVIFNEMGTYNNPVKLVTNEKGYEFVGTTEPKFQIRFVGERYSYLAGKFLPYDEAMENVDAVLHGRSPKSER